MSHLDTLMNHLDNSVANCGFRILSSKAVDAFSEAPSTLMSLGLLLINSPTVQYNVIMAIGAFRDGDYELMGVSIGSSISIILNFHF